MDAEVKERTGDRTRRTVSSVFHGCIYGLSRSRACDMSSHRWRALRRSEAPEAQAAPRPPRAASERATPPKTRPGATDQSTKAHEKKIKEEQSHSRERVTAPPPRSRGYARTHSQ